MTEAAAKLIQLFESEHCDYDRCRALIREIGGCTKIIPDDNFKTTPLHEAVSGGHYDFAMELIREPGADLNVAFDWCGPLMWELQYLNEESKEKRCLESKQKLRLARALIEAGADPNPVVEGEELMYYVRFKVGEREGDGTDQWHNYQLEHIVEAHAYGQTEHFFEKVRTMPIENIWVSDWGFWLFDDDVCDADHAIFVFEDGERYLLSSYQTGEDEWDFYAVSVEKDIRLNPEKHHEILPQSGKIAFLGKEGEDLALSIDDAALLILPMEGYLSIGLSEFPGGCFEKQDRQILFMK